MGVVLVLVLVLVVMPSRSFGGERCAPVLLNAKWQPVRGAEHWGGERVAVTVTRAGFRKAGLIGLLIDDFFLRQCFTM